MADVLIEGAFQRDLFANLGAGGLALMFPVRTSGMQRLIGTVPESLSRRDDLTYEDLREQVEPLLGVHVTEVNWFSIYRVHHRVAERFRVGQVFVAGDAGHIHSPAGGQGMNTGIGDAVNLSWKLAYVLQGRAKPAILDSYESEHIAFARTLVASTDRLLRRGGHQHNPECRRLERRSWRLLAMPQSASPAPPKRDHPGKKTALSARLTAVLGKPSWSRCNPH